MLPTDSVKTTATTYAANDRYQQVAPIQKTGRLAAAKRIVTSILKIAAAITAAGLALGLIAWAIFAIAEHVEKVQLAPLAQAKTWPKVKVAVFGDTTFRLRTKWRDGQIYYQFSCDSYPEAVREARDRGGATFNLVFADKDGFDVFSHSVPLNDVSGVIGEDGATQALSWSGNEYISADQYGRLADWRIGWNGISTEPKQQRLVAPIAPNPIGGRRVDERPKWRVTAQWRKLRQGQSKSDVEQLLGPAGKIDELGFESKWYYGYPSGGEVEFGSNGLVDSWSEP